MPCNSAGQVVREERIMTDYSMNQLRSNSGKHTPLKELDQGADEHSIFVTLLASLPTAAFQARSVDQVLCDCS